MPRFHECIFLGGLPDGHDEAWPFNSGFPGWALCVLFVPLVLARIGSRHVLAAGSKVSQETCKKILYLNGMV